MFPYPSFLNVEEISLMKRKFLSLLSLLVLSVAACTRATQPAAPAANQAQATNAAATPAAPRTHLKVGDAAPDFTLSNTKGEQVKLSDFKGKKNVVLAFYVLAFTGG
jgi:cytochrome oxidase Cu insertion factor (SCO1/SenC/PrrC family)